MARVMGDTFTFFSWLMCGPFFGSSCTAFFLFLKTMAQRETIAEINGIISQTRTLLSAHHQDSTVQDMEGGDLVHALIS